MKPIGGVLLIDDYDKDLFIDENELNNELMDQALRYMKYAKLKAKAHKNVKSIKRMLDQVMAQVRIEVRNSDKTLKVADVDAIVDCHESVLKVRIELEDAEFTAECMVDATLAFRQRGEMLKEYSANRRKEIID